MSAEEVTLGERLAEVLGGDVEYGLGVEPSFAGEATVGLGMKADGFERLLALAEAGKALEVAEAEALALGDEDS